MIEKPTKNLVGTRALVKIRDLNHDGDGVGRLENLVTFVPGALPGEEVEVEIESLYKKFLRAKLLDITVKSADRATPPCPHYYSCGGCQLQHLAYQAQLAWKEARVKEALNRIGKLEVPVLPIIGMDSSYRYRNKARFHISADRNSLRAGFFKSNSRQIIEIEDCLIQHPHNMLAIKAIRKAFADNAAPGGKGRKLLPDIHEAELRSSYATGQVLITLGYRGRLESSVSVEGFSKSISKYLGDKLAGILVKTGRNKNIQYQLISGSPFIEERIEPFCYRISSPSFFQVNSQQAKRLFELAASYAGNPDTAYDLYCGTGNFALYLSQAANEVVGVDSEVEAIEDARKNAAANGINNVKFIASPIEKAGELLRQGKRPITIILDPPRKGCSASLSKTMAEIKPERIVYISCNPATLARDLGLFQQSGFQAIKAQPVDMFPQTSHVETVALMTRVGK